MMKNIKNILVITNFSASSANAVKTGIAMCKRHNSALHLLFIRKDNTGSFPPGKNARLIESILKSYVDRQEALQSQAKAIQQHHNISCFYHLANGPFGEATAATAGDFKCDLIIVEKPAGRGFSIPSHNSMSRMLRYVDRPILTVPANNSYTDFKRILIPVRPRFSDLEKLHFALPILKRNNACVTIVGAVAAQNAAADKPFMATLLRTACTLLSRDAIRVENEIFVSKNPAKEVLLKATEKNSDMIVVTHKPRSGWQGLLSSGYSEYIIAGATVPVLTVKLS